MDKETQLSLSELFDALTFAAEHHKYQRRGGYDRLPYINHLLKVTKGIIQVGQETDRDLILAALLHDIIEDTKLSEEDLKEKFGDKVAGIVHELSDDMNLSYAERKRKQIETASRLSLEARKIRIADKASNIRDIVTYPLDWPKEKKVAYIKNAQKIVDQIRGTHPRLEEWFDEEAKNGLFALES